MLKLEGKMNWLLGKKAWLIKIFYPSGGNGKVFVFHAGRGKTYYISKSNLHLPSCVWLTVTPDVQQQSRRELEEVSRDL